MARQISRGTCAFCQAEFSKTTIARHLETCQRKAREAAGRRPGRTMKHFHIVVEGCGLPMYWMHLQVRTGITLADLDVLQRCLGGVLRASECLYHRRTALFLECRELF
ncbi:MAG TPA: hypothetical protein VGF67_02845 [Ktedonobacteraceae bacterium]|jgi:hypothetical protein